MAIRVKSEEVDEAFEILEAETSHEYGEEEHAALDVLRSHIAELSEENESLRTQLGVGEALASGDHDDVLRDALGQLGAIRILAEGWTSARIPPERASDTGLMWTVGTLHSCGQQLESILRGDEE
jgi:hypothetical protein